MKASVFTTRNLPEHHPYLEGSPDNHTARNGIVIALAFIVLLILALAWPKFHEKKDQIPRWMRGTGTQSGGFTWNPDAEERLLVDVSSSVVLQRHDYRD